MSMNRKEPTEALATQRGDAITITTEQCIKAWREAVPDALDDPTHVDVVGAMGSASSIALGIALAQPGRKVIVMDGDGSLLMQLGSLVTIAGAAPENLYWRDADGHNWEILTVSYARADSPTLTATTV